jgi:hypothetical protein
MAFNRFAIAFALAAMVGGSTPGLAQYAPTEPSADEVAAARNCLCLERSVEDRRFELDVRNGIFEKSLADLQTVERDVEQRRAKVDVNDQGQIDAFRTLLARADAARTHYEQTAVPEQQQAVGRYNAVVDRLNAACKGRSFTTYAWQAARKDLVCPRN